MAPNRASWTTKLWTSKRQVEEARREEQRVRDELRHKEQLEWQRERENQELQDMLAREQEQLARERRDRALQEARLREHQREQDAIYREAEARRQEQARQERERQEWERNKALQEERQRQEEELRRRAQKQARRIERMKKLKMISPDSLYVLRELIRTRYALDVEIWSLRRVRRVDRGIVEDKMEKADAVLGEIRAMVNAWQGTEESWTKVEWLQAQDIQRRLLSDGKREWLNDPPWDDE
jgi:hypothetical protein